MKAFVFDAAHCNGCHNCQFACKDETVGNEWPPYSLPQPDTGSFWCRLDEIEHGQLPMVKVEYRMHICHHCDNAPCIAAAPEAFYKREDGLVILDPAAAKGRKELLDVCPYGAIWWNDELEVAQKCTGCAHLVDEGKLPHCVDHCPTGGWRFGEEEDFADELEGAERLSAPEHGGRVFYINLPKLFIGGQVWDPVPNEVIEGAKVTLFGADGEKLVETASDWNGDFYFRKLEEGTYRVLMEAEGFQPVEREIRLDKSLNIGDFPMEAVGEEG